MEAASLMANRWGSGRRTLVRAAIRTLSVARLNPDPLATAFQPIALSRPNAEWRAAMPIILSS